MSHLSVMLESMASKEPAKAAACEAIAGLAAAAASIAAVIRQPDAVRRLVPFAAVPMPTVMTKRRLMFWQMK